uniref:Odorant binding protein 12 n=1 Tax=Colaphellus bowringi TaxID=561076 RepID=A0A0S3J2K7_9CUCU|nr:odorant binding protein 12 [Colaphellus bowringi]
MKSVVLLIISCCLSYSMALECGIAKANRNEIRQALSMCVKNNDTLEDILEMSSLSSSTTSSPTEDSDDEDSQEDTIKSTSSTTKSPRRIKSSRIKRARSFSNTKQYASKATERNREESNNSNNTNNKIDNLKDAQKDDSEDDNEVSQETPKKRQDMSENCIVHCVLEHLNLTDETGLPDHSKLSEELLKTASGRELRNFLQESTDECFQEVNEENDLDSCSYTTKLITCLADKGKSNCADWPAGALPF